VGKGREGGERGEEGGEEGKGRTPNVLSALMA